MTKVEAASGARYSAHKEAPRRFEPIAPVGTNYTPIGRPDIAAMRRTPAVQPSPARPAAPSTAPRPVPQVPPSTVRYGQAPARASDTWEEDKDTVAPPPPPPATRPTPPASSRPSFSVCYSSLLVKSCLSLGVFHSPPPELFRHPQHRLFPPPFRRNLKTRIVLAL